MATISEARYLACAKFPYLSHAIISLIPRQQDGLGTLATTKDGVMHYDPAVERWPADALAGGLVHEAMHLVLSHHALCDEIHAQPFIWNLAGDMVINQAVTQVFALPNPGLPKTFGLHDGLNVYEYYTALIQQAERIKCKNCCGSASGNSHEVEKKGNSQESGRSKAEIEGIKRQTAQAIKNHTRHKGSIPAFLDVWADTTLAPPKVPWQQKLRCLVTQGISHAAGKVDMKYGHISRRQWGIGIGNNKPILPSLRAPVPRVAVAIDTSGSMGQNELRLAITECQGILRAVNAKVQFLACDTRVHVQKKVDNISDIKKSLKGGGGTSFIPVFDSLTTSPPDVLVFMTDGYGSAPPCAPPYKVIWLLVGTSSVVPAAYGTPIKVE